MKNKSIVGACQEWSMPANVAARYEEHNKRLETALIRERDLIEERKLAELESEAMYALRCAKKQVTSNVVMQDLINWKPPLMWFSANKIGI